MSLEVFSRKGNLTSSIFKVFFSLFFFPITCVFSPTGEPDFVNSAFYLKSGHKITICIHWALNFEDGIVMFEMGG